MSYTLGGASSGRSGSKPRCTNNRSAAYPRSNLPLCPQAAHGDDSDYMIDPGARLYATGGTSAGGVIGTVIDIITSRPGALLISGTLAYLLYKSPAARKELWGTAKGQYHHAKTRLGPKHGPAF